MFLSSRGSVKVMSVISGQKSPLKAQLITDSCYLQRHIHAGAVFRTTRMRKECRHINKTRLQIIKEDTYFISRTSSKCFLLSARRLVKWVSFSAKDCCVEDNFAFIDSSSCLTFSIAIISSST